METVKIKWGIIGPGKIANKFAQDLKTVPNAQLYAVASRSIERAREFASLYSCEKSYGNYRDIAEDPEVDVIYIATPHVFHYENTLLCLKNKKAVLCEKPMAMNKSQAEEMILTARRENVFLMEGLWTCFLPHFRHVLQLVETKKYGELKKLTADFGFKAPLLPEKRLFNKALGGGSLLDIGIYPVFLALSLMGNPYDISANAEICETGVDKNCSVIFSYKDGREAYLESSIDKMSSTTARLEFEEATVVINSRFHEPTSLTIINGGTESILDFTANTYGYNFEAAHVQQMLTQSKKESDLLNLDMSLQIAGVLDKIRKQIHLEY